MEKGQIRSSTCCCLLCTEMNTNAYIQAKNQVNKNLLDAIETLKKKNKDKLYSPYEDRTNAAFWYYK